MEVRWTPHTTWSPGSDSSTSPVADPLDLTLTPPKHPPPPSSPPKEAPVTVGVRCGAAHGGLTLWLLGGSHLSRTAGGAGGTFPLEDKHQRPGGGSSHKEPCKVCLKLLHHPPWCCTRAPPLCSFVAPVTCQSGRGIDLSYCGPFAFMAPQELCKSHSSFSCALL